MLRIDGCDCTRQGWRCKDCPFHYCIVNNCIPRVSGTGCQGCHVKSVDGGRFDMRIIVSKWNPIKQWEMGYLLFSEHQGQPLSSWKGPFNVVPRFVNRRSAVNDRLMRGDEERSHRG